jgi:hypothetical protein
METQEYHVEGPVMIFLTTTATDIDEELQNRCLVLTVDESREQTERIHALAARSAHRGRARSRCRSSIPTRSNCGSSRTGCARGAITRNICS